VWAGEACTSIAYNHFALCIPVAMQNSGVHNGRRQYYELGFVEMMLKSGFWRGRGVCPLSFHQGLRNGGFVDRD
jgi:hypothetical protein